MRARPRHASLRLAVAALALVLPGPPVAASGLVRVAIVESARDIELRGAAIAVVPLPTVNGRPTPCEQCRAAGWRTELVRATIRGPFVEVDGHRAAAFRLESERPIRVNGREYPAAIELVMNGDGMAVVNELPLEEYLVGVVRAEGDERWPLETLRALAIVARTYAAHHRRLGAGKPYHLVASTAHQQYAGRVPLSSPVWQAVEETQGRVLLLDGEVFPAFYHTESGGYTEDPRTVFAAPNMPRLKPVVCRFSVGSPHYSWNLDLLVTDLAERLRRSGIDLGRVTAIEVTERTAALRAAVVTVRGTRGLARLRGNDFRRIIGYDVLKSTLFAVAVNGGVARFTGRGYGHGVGMCQWGAKGMAEQGYGTEEILDFYYPGTTLGTLEGR